MRVSQPDIRLLRPAFPDRPSDRLRFPRLQLRGSAGFSPASHEQKLQPMTWREPRFEKEQKMQSRIYWQADGKVNRRLSDDGAMGLINKSNQREAPNVSRFSRRGKDVNT
jgi:hypothetical protein